MVNDYLARASRLGRAIFGDGVNEASIGASDMKVLHITAAAALLTNTIIASPAFAAVTLISPVPAADPAGLTAENLATAQAQCDTAAAAADLDGPAADSDAYTAEVVEGAVTLTAGPTEVGTESDRNIDESTRVGAGTFTPAHLEILGDPYRNGGSVNMFGIQQSVGGHYSNSAYDFTADFKTTYSHAYTCTISKAVFHPEQIIHHPAVGIYVITGDFGDSEDAIRGNCAAFTAQGSDPNNLPDWWGDAFHGGSDDNPHCMFQGTPASDETIDAYFENPVVVASDVPGGTFSQDQIDELSAHESMGAGFDTDETLLIGQVVVCISPSTATKKLPGAWRQQNGYTGDKCTTAWYNGGATVGVPNLNDGSHNWVTVPVV